MEGVKERGLSNRMIIKWGQIKKDIVIKGRQSRVATNKGVNERSKQYNI